MGNTLSFSVLALQAVVDAVKAAPKHRPAPYTDDATGPGLWLVGDSGVYLMGNHVHEGKPVVVYSKEAGPNDYEVKRRIFGGDDGVEFIALAEVEPWLASWSGKPCAEISMTPESLALVSLAPRAKA